MATTFLSPVGNDANFTVSGVPASGYKLFTYLAGTTTKQTTYQDNAAVTPNANPIILSSQGYPASGGSIVEIWLTQGVNYKFVLAPSTDTDPPSSPVWTRDNITAINDPTSITSTNEWVQGTTPTFISTTSFSVVGDQRTTYQVGRRVKTVNSGGTIYSRISASSFASSITTVTVINDSGVLDSGLSSVSYGVLSVTNPSVPVLNVASIGATTPGTGVFTTGTFTNFTSQGIILTRATADQGITTQTALVSATNMVVTVAANEEWILDIYWDVGALLSTTGIKVGINAPAGAVANLVANLVTDGNTPANINALSSRTTALNTAVDFLSASLTNISNSFVHASAWVLNGATPGTIQWQFAQSTSSATALTIRKGSHMISFRIGG